MIKKLTLTSMCALLVGVTPVSADLKDVAKGVIIYGIAKELSKNRKKTAPKSSGRSTRKSTAQSSASKAQWVSIQSRLNELGYDAGPADGKPGGRTKRALIAFQKDSGLDPDGAYGQKTKAALFGGAAVIASQQLDPIVGTIDENDPSVLTAGGGSEAAHSFQSLEIADLIANKDGIWEGRLKCSDGIRVNIDLVLSIAPNNSRYSSYLTTYSSASGSGRTEQDTFVGEANLQPGSFLFARAGSKSEPISGTDITSFSVDDQQGGNILLTPSDNRCSPVSMALVDKRARPTFALKQVEDGGKFNAGADTKTKCGALVEWAGMYEKGSQIDLLFTDKVFIPVFGQPFDTLTASERQKIFEKDVKTGKACTSDPIMNARFQDTGKYLEYGFSRETYAKNRIYTNRVVQRNRLVNNRLASMISADGQSPVTESDLQNYSNLENYIETNAYALLPQEKKSALSWISESRAERSRLAATAYADSLAQVADPIEKLMTLKNYRSYVSSQLRYLPLQEKREFEDEMQAVQASLSEAVVQPVLLKASSATLSFDGMKAIQAGPVAEINQMPFLNDTVKVQALEKLNSEVSLRLELILAERLGELATFEAGTKGLRQSSKWFAAFDQDFSAFLGFPEVTESMKQYAQFRESQLENALAEFQNHLETVKTNEQIDTLKNMYIASAQDAELPIALEYEFWAEAAKN